MCIRDRCFLLLASCEKHIEVEDIYTKYKIGNILCSDGSITHPSIIENKTPIAVISIVETVGKKKQKT